jgi:hypothetical protein
MGNIAHENLHSRLGPLTALKILGLFLLTLPNQGIEPQFAIYKIAVLTVVLIRLNNTP